MGPSGSGREKTVVETKVEYRDWHPFDAEQLEIIRQLIVAAETAHEGEALPASMGVLASRQKDLKRIQELRSALNSYFYSPVIYQPYKVVIL